MEHGLNAIKQHSVHYLCRSFVLNWRQKNKVAAAWLATVSNVFCLWSESYDEHMPESEACTFFFQIDDFINE